MRIVHFVACLALALTIMTSEGLAQNGRRKTITNNGVTCSVPPDEILQLSKKIGFDVKISAIKDILTKGAQASGEGAVQATYERVRAETSSLQLFEVLHYRLCMDFSNKAIDQKAYQLFLTQILPLLTKEKIEPSKDSTPKRQVWKPIEDVYEEQLTGNHHCPRNCNGEPTRTGYKIKINLQPGLRYSQPSLKCIAGPCAWSAINYVRLNNDGSAEASFDVWSLPTRWRLTAKAEKLFNEDGN